MGLFWTSAADVVKRGCAKVVVASSAGAAAASPASQGLSKGHYFWVGGFFAIADHIDKRMDNIWTTSHATLHHGYGNAIPRLGFPGT